MKIGRNRRRRRHRVRQPEMKRELRALGEGADQDENQRRQIEGMAADQITGVQHPIHVVASDDVTEQHEADEQAYRSEEHTSELQSLMRISYAVFCLKKKKKPKTCKH